MREYGLIGYPLSHSFSKKYFTQKFLEEDIADAVFHNFSIEKIELLEEILQQYPQLKGLSVTIPYKKSVINFLDEVSEVVKKIGACNCIQIHNNKKNGFNTDVTGFEKSFTAKLSSHHTNALVLGSGGAAAAVEFVLQKLNIQYKLVSRTKKNNCLTYDEITQALLNNYTIIINCTPLGTFPNITEAPQLPYQFLTPNHYLFDLVYNPSVTKFLQHGIEKHCTIQNGYDMLVIQAEENWKIWNS